MKQDYIREFNGKALGIIETDANGDQLIRDFDSLQILGFYKVRYNHTTDFMGRVVASGNTLVQLLYDYKAKKK